MHQCTNRRSLQDYTKQLRADEILMDKKLLFLGRRQFLYSKCATTKVCHCHTELQVFLWNESTNIQSNKAENSQSFGYNMRQLGRHTLNTFMNHLNSTVPSIHNVTRK